MILQFTKDNVGRFHIELLNDDSTPMLPREGFASHSDMRKVANAHVEDITAVKAYAE